MNRILIVCIGNICRSPMAEAILQQRLLDRGLQIEVSSAGLHALVDSPADPMAQELLAERGVDISMHRARQLTQKLVFDADLILTMDSKQEQQLVHHYLGAKGRVYRIGQISGFDVSDPYKRPRVIFEQALALIDQGVDEWQKRLWN